MYVYIMDNMIYWMWIKNSLCLWFKSWNGFNAAAAEPLPHTSESTGDISANHMLQEVRLGQVITALSLWYVYANVNTIHIISIVLWCSISYLEDTFTVSNYY